MHLLCSFVFITVLIVSVAVIWDSVLKALDDPQWEDY